ncbi:U-box domain-containing protein 19-like [Neltuma alba]|uniref:U-box domain-containing protein 19-like n=1 Tax=Neltuma alba TaxID=207710 RepID=UPI0010A463DB|nr:U-box domain-containing protein 19-like [Prosopis alba]
MTRYSNHDHRRLLSSPAVFPCRDVSPSTLLTSLISLSLDICNFQSRFFPTQKRNAREIIRQVSIILIFLQELAEIPKQSPVLCFSELHFSFQKILFLLQDCTRDGARLWMLMKSQYVASEFRVLIRGVATALDVLPLHWMKVCGEVKELVELVANQARKVKFEVPRDDEENSKRVRSILRQFEKGVEPDVADMKPVLDYLEIKTWADCNNEIEFFLDEMHFQRSECDEREVPLLSGLIGFLSYCRGVIFETHDCRKHTDFSEGTYSSEMIKCMNPEDFRCPISLELMMDPVTVSTGQTYDRTSIQQWLKSGNKICPKTGAKLKNTDLIPNTALRKLIQQLCVAKGVSLTKLNNQSCDIAKTIVPGSPAAAHATQFLSWFLARRLVFGTMEEKNKAAYEIRLLARSNIFNRSCLIQVGTVSPLLLLLSTRDNSTQENSIAALLKLSKHNKGKEAIIENGGLKSIVTVLKKGLSPESRQIAAAIIFYLASVKQHRKSIGENPEVIPCLVELMKEGTTCGKKHAMVAIFGLLLNTSNHKRVIEANTVQVLVDMLTSSEKDDVATDSLTVLGALAENSEGAEAMMKASALPQIIGILKSTGKNSGKEHCVSILLSLCVNGGEDVIGVMAKDPSIMASLYSLLTDGTSRATKKARFLIRILHEFNEKPICSVAEQQTLEVIDLLGRN